MALEDHRKISLYKEAEAGLSSLFQQTAQVFIGFLVMLLVTGGNPPSWVVTFSFLTGIGFVAWSENKRLEEFEAGKLSPDTPDREQQTATSEGSAAVEVPQSNVDLTNAENYPIQKAIDLKLANIAGMTRDKDLAGADLICANLSNAHLIYADLSRADLSRANLIYADLFCANLIYANLSDANLSGASLIYANLSDANLSGASLSGADLFCANLSRANLSGADLSHADLGDANLSDANLGSANLSDAFLICANLSSANLSGADLSGANVKNAIFGWNDGLSEEMKLDLKRRGARFQDSLGDRDRTSIPK